MPLFNPVPGYAALRLGPTFDAERLRADVAGLPDSDWIPHFNMGYHDGGWFGIPLRAAAGSLHPLYPDPTQVQFVDLPVLEQSPAIRAVMAAFKCPLRSVRLLKLRAGSVIREHRDDGLGFEDGEVRLHIPIVTNPGMAFYLDGERLPMAPGQTWYVNVNLPHRVHNAGTTDRIHLVIDCTVNDWIAALFAGGERFANVQNIPPAQSPPYGSIKERLDALLQCVWDNSVLQARLFETEDTDLFVRQVSAAARDQGIALSVDEARDTLQRVRREWNLRNTFR